MSTSQELARIAVHLGGRHGPRIETSARQWGRAERVVSRGIEAIGLSLRKPQDGRSVAGSSEISPVAELLARLEEPYDPVKGPFDRYRERARRIVQQLQSAGATVDVRGLQKRMYQGECRAATLGMEPEDKRRWLRVSGRIS